MAAVYDAEKVRLLQSIYSIRNKLENQLSIEKTDVKAAQLVCNAVTKSAMHVFPGNIKGEEYLAYITVQCQLERLSDLLELKYGGKENALVDEEIRSATRFFMLNEALALVLAGLAKVTKMGDVFYLAPFDQGALEILRATWFARWTDQNSHAATLALVTQLNAQEVKITKAIPLIALRILDQDLSIPWMKIDASTKLLKSVSEIYNVCSLVAALMYLSVQNKQLNYFTPDITQLGIDFSAVSNLMRYNANSLLTDRFVVHENGHLKVHVGSVSKGLRSYYLHLAQLHSEEDDLRLRVGGKFYEDNIRNKIETDGDYTSRYRIADGFDRHKVLDEKELGECDVEFIIHDHDLSHYYFVQIKHAILGEKAFFNAAISAVQSDFAKGLRQLRGAKRLLDEQRLEKTLAQRGIANANSKNSTFILIHNIAQFDYQITDDGICLYDWASFRNLLLDGEVMTGHSHSMDSVRRIRLPTPLNLNSPSNVIDRLLNEHPAYVKIRHQAWAAEHITTSYPIGNATITLTGLGI
ncbi:hypothetical protein [Herbaspirillum huttiense]|uniref:hypothetical protein n=1 Tax=Herbaspirillum huttiense TaxID=863372 RepID=UPI0031DE5155